jgi:hypothetical protein
LQVIIDTAADKLILEIQREAEELSNEYGGIGPWISSLHIFFFCMLQTQNWQHFCHNNWTSKEVDAIKGR